MIRSRTALATLALAGLFAIAFVTIAMLAPRPRLIWNASASTAVGLYRLTPVSHPMRGMLVAIMPPAALARYLDEHRYLPLGVPLLKHIAAAHGAHVCRFGRRVTINGNVVAIALDRDRRGRPLPKWHGCHVVRRGELFVLNAAPDSMDGRYFGVIPASGLLGCAMPILTRDTPGEPLRWRGPRINAASSTSQKGQSSCR